MQLTLSNIETLETRYRTSLINSLSGIKSANLIGTISSDGTPNCAVFSSVVHLGADPAMMGMVVRPNVVPRHTLDNLQSTKTFTINHIGESFYEKAHITSARTEQNEFDMVGLTPRYIDNFSAPFVSESAVQIGLEWVRTVEITENGTHFVIGRVVHIGVDDALVLESGDIDLNAANSVGVMGLYTYQSLSKLQTLPYAKSR